MDPIPIICSSCGATIKAKQGQTEATCKFCYSVESVVLQPAAPVVIDFERQHQLMLIESEVARLQRQLSKLDSDWRRQRAAFHTKLVEGPLLIAWTSGIKIGTSEKSQLVSWDRVLTRLTVALVTICFAVLVADSQIWLMMGCFVFAGILIHLAAREAQLVRRMKPLQAHYGAERIELNRLLLAERRRLEEFGQG